MPREPIVLGIDLATANARVVAVGLETGRSLFEAGAPLAPPRGPATGWSEQDANYADVVLGLVRQVTLALGTAAADVQALSTTGTSGTIVPCDGAGRPAGAALMYNDQRAVRELDEIAVLGPEGPFSTLARACWLERHSPASRYLNTPDVVHAALAGRALPSDTSHSLKSAIKVDSGAWDVRLLDAMELPVAKMGSLVPPGTRIGEVASTQSAVLGLSTGVQVIAGMTDGCTAQIGAGAVRDGDVVGVLGTTLVIKSVARTNVVSPDFVVYSHKSPDGRYWPGGASNVGAGALSSRFGATPEDLAAGNRAAEHHGVARSVAYPLGVVGERFPFLSPTAEFFCVGGDNSKVDNYRAIMEGAAFTERLGVERLVAMGVSPQRFLVTGGGSSSSLWNTIRATVLGSVVYRPESHNSAFGAAMIAAAALSGETLAAVSRRMVSINGTFEPNRAQAPALEENYQRFITQLLRRGYLHQ